jgi:hypothetical protein
MHTKLHGLVKPLFMALVFGLLVGCGGSSNNGGGDDDAIPRGGNGTGNNSNTNITFPPVANNTLVYPYDLPCNVAAYCFAQPSVPAGVTLPSANLTNNITQIETQVTNSEYTITYTGVSADVANNLSKTLRNGQNFLNDRYGFFSLSNTGKARYASAGLTKATALIALDANGLYSVTFGVILDGKAADRVVDGYGFFENLFGVVDAPVSTISTTYFYVSGNLAGAAWDIPPYAFEAYSELLQLPRNGFTLGSSNFVLTSVPPFKDFTGVHDELIIGTLQKDIGEFRYQWSYTKQYKSALPTVGSFATWTLIRISSI